MTHPAARAHSRSVIFITKLQSWLLLASALLILLLCANHRSYAPKQSINGSVAHTVMHITPGDVLTWIVALVVLLPILEKTRFGRIISWFGLAAIAAGAVLLSHKGHDFVKVVHQGLHSSHMKGAAAGGFLLVLAIWQFVRLLAVRRELISGESENRSIRLVLPSLPIAAWALIGAGILSSVTMVLPTESLHDLIHTSENHEPIRKAALFLIQLVQHLGIALFLFMLVLRSPGRVRLCVRSLLLATTAGICLAGLQYVHHVRPADVEGLMQSRNAYGGFLCLALPLALGSLLGSRRRLVQIAYGIFIAAGMLTILSGGAFWCCLLGLVVTGLMSGGKKGMAASLAAVFLALAILGLRPQNREQVASKFFTLRTVYAQDEGNAPSTPPSATVKKEYVEWVAGICMASEHLWTGVGPGQYQLNIGEYYGQDPNPDIRLETDSNNLYFVYLASLGLAGLVPLLQLIFDALAASWRTSRRNSGAAIRTPDVSDWKEWWRTNEGRALAAGVCGAMSAFLVVNLFTAMLIRGTGIAFAFILALAASMNGKPCAELSNHTAGVEAA